MSSEAFTQLVDAHYASLYRFALSLAKRPEDAGDLPPEYPVAIAQPKI